MVALTKGFSAELPNRVFLGVVRAFALAVERSEPYVGGHQRGTTRFAVRLARRLRFSRTSVRLIEVGALLHDVGKIGIPRSILLRPGRLSAAEFGDGFVEKGEAVSGASAAGPRQPAVPRPGPEQAVAL